VISFFHDNLVFNALYFAAIISLSVSAIRSPLDSHKNVSSSLTSYYYYYYYYFRVLKYVSFHLTSELRGYRALLWNLLVAFSARIPAKLNQVLCRITVLETSAKIQIIQIIRWSAAPGPLQFAIHNNSVVTLDVLW